MYAVHIRPRGVYVYAQIYLPEIRLASFQLPHLSVVSFLKASINLRITFLIFYKNNTFAKRITQTVVLKCIKRITSNVNSLIYHFLLSPVP